MSETWIQEMIDTQLYYSLVEGFTTINEDEEIPFDDYEEDVA